MIRKVDMNVSSVMVGAKRVRLHPLSPSSVVQKKVEKKTNLFLSFKEFEREVKRDGYGYALFVRHATTSKIP